MNHLKILVVKGIWNARPLATAPIVVPPLTHVNPHLVQRPLEEYAALDPNTFVNFPVNKVIAELIQIDGGSMPKLEIAKNSFIPGVKEMPITLIHTVHAKIIAVMLVLNLSVFKAQL